VNNWTPSRNQAASRKSTERETEGTPTVRKWTTSWQERQKQPANVV
jgi:hypothetical protein